MVPADRITVVGDRPVDPRGEHVLYWMNANRRLSYNHALERAAEWAHELKKPLLVLEALRVGYRWASDRHHAFVMDGMREHAAALEGSGVGYYPYVERTAGEGRGLVAALARRAAVVVTDDWPSFFLPRAVRAAAPQIPARFEKVDSAGLLPMRAAARAYPMAFAFRSLLLKTLRPHLDAAPKADPLARDRPAFRGAVEDPRWPCALPRLDALPIDHAVRASHVRGGSAAARARLAEFLKGGLARFEEERNQPSSGAASRLSPYLHYGMISSFEVLEALRRRRKETYDALLPPKAKEWGWEASFVDELVTWREIGLNMCHHRDDYDAYTSLPEWARATLEEHEADARPMLYTLEELEGAKTADPIWNAAQRQLLEEGIIHNYLRMLWGKKILEWSPTARDALERMIHLNNKHALDGRDPNSYSGIFWTLGRYDRPWPERPVFGTVRCMTSASTAKKLDLKAYLERWGPRGTRPLL